MKSSHLTSGTYAEGEATNTAKILAVGNFVGLRRAQFCG